MSDRPDHEALHALARTTATAITDPDRKQLRFNEIVDTAWRFYPADPEAGVREMVSACDRAQTDLYIKGQPMWATLQDQYGWMLA